MKDYTPPGSAYFSQGGGGIFNKQTIAPTQPQNLATTQVHQIIRFAQPQPTFNPFMGKSVVPATAGIQIRSLVKPGMTDEDNDTELREIVRKEGGKIIWRRFIRVKKN